MSQELVYPLTGHRDWFISQFFESARIGQQSECWEWVGRKAHGYGYLTKQTKPAKVVRVHRLVYEIVHNVLLRRDQYVHHSCRNRACYNPAHLSLTDPHLHMRDHHLPTHCLRGHEFTPDNTYVHKSRSGTRRHCRTCRRALERERYAEQYKGEAREKLLADLRERYRNDTTYRENLLRRRRERYKAKHG